MTGVKDSTKLLNLVLIKSRQTGRSLTMIELMRDMQMKFNQAMMWGADKMLVKKKRIRRKMKKNGSNSSTQLGI